MSEDDREEGLECLEKILSFCSDKDVCNLSVANNNCLHFITRLRERESFWKIRCEYRIWQDTNFRILLTTSYNDTWKIMRERLKNPIFVSAVRFGYLSIVRFYFRHNLYKSEYNTLLSDNLIVLACFRKHSEVAQALLESGKVDVTEGNRNTLEVAIESGYSDIVKLLLKNPKIQIKTSKYLQLARSKRSTDITMQLLKDGRSTYLPVPILKIWAIVGPITWNYFTYKGVKFHLFGDYHSKSEVVEKEIAKAKNEDRTITIRDLVHNISQRSVNEKQYVNFFLEIGQQGREEGTKYKNSLLYDTIKSLPTCTIPDKTRCDYTPYSKFHSTDVRGAKTIFGFFYTIITDKRIELSMLQRVFHTLRDDLKARSDIFWNMTVAKNNGKAIENVFRKRLRLADFVKESFKKGTDMHRIRYNIMAIPEDIRERIIKFFYPMYLDGVKNLISAIDDFDKGRIQSGLLDIQLPIMDAYTVARMFRSMQWDKDCKMIFAYFGALHTSNYHKFFLTLPETQTILDEGEFIIDVPFTTTYLINAMEKSDSTMQKVFNFKAEKIFGSELFN